MTSLCQSSPKNKEAKQFASFFWKNHRTLVKNLFWTPSVASLQSPR
ncbi:hypothetical protein HPSMNH_0677 [Glaesserella parasuis MN-H]|nr:hypothetical protein HPSMNH_0677 [Glaesserella parasuis MN-H]EQA09555.1 hypothetical protein HPSH465_1036 [Glaesserella parasuis H465]